MVSFWPTPIRIIALAIISLIATRAIQLIRKRAEQSSQLDKHFPETKSRKLVILNNLIEIQKTDFLIFLVVLVSVSLSTYISSVPNPSRIAGGLLPTEKALLTQTFQSAHNGLPAEPVSAIAEYDLLSKLSAQTQRDEFSKAVDSLIRQNLVNEIKRQPTKDGGLTHTLKITRLGERVVAELSQNGGL